MNRPAQSNEPLPRVFVFNPLAEARIAGGKGFSPTKHQAQMERDLAHLPQFLCRHNDIVIVPQRPAEHFLNGLKLAGFLLPEFVVDVAALADRKLGGLYPWAWGPDSVELLHPLFKNVIPEVRPASTYFNAGLAALYSKVWSAEFLAEVVVNHGSAPWLCTPNEVGVITNRTEATLNAVAAIRSRGHHQVVLKQAVGVAGSNALRLFEPEVLPTQKRWIENTHASGQPIVVEPWLERKLDFSVQLEMRPDGLMVCGYTGLITTPSGQFAGNWAEPKFEESLPTAILDSFGRDQGVEKFYSATVHQLETNLRKVGFLGPIGIDALVYHAAGGGLRLKPIVEINPRYTMGRLTVELMRHVHPGSFGVLQLLSQATIRAAGTDSFASFAQRLTEQYPLGLEEMSAQRIQKGAVCPVFYSSEQRSESKTPISWAN